MQDDSFELAGIRVPYNYHSPRGFIDVVLRKKTPDCEEWIVSELKSHLDDIGEALRQVHRAKTCFSPGTGRCAPPDTVFDLVVEAHVENERAWRNNIPLFSQVPIRWQIVESRDEGLGVVARIEVEIAVQAAGGASGGLRTQIVVT